MTPLATPLDSPDALEQGFSDGLAAMLATHRGLGVYILVLANAAYDPALWSMLARDLAARHAALTAELVDSLRHGRKLAEPDDDVLVFLKLHAIGFDRLGTMESRRIGPWDAMFNPIRALRPPRSSAMAFTGLLRPFDPAGFHFNKPFLARERLWEGEMAGKPARLLYNKFPFARLHSLLVPEPLRELPQMLTPELHGWAWDLCTASGVPDLCLGYNSTGAGASINHLHFQSFVQSTPLPVQHPRFVPNGGTTAYPVPCSHCSDPGEAWVELDRLHQQQQPYNLIYSKAGLHILPRIPHDSPGLGADSRGYGWSELAGAVTLFSRDAYETLDSQTFEAMLARFAP